MMLRDGLTRWVAPTITGEVTVELRRGDDYTLIDTRAERMAYDPHKLSMEKVASAFAPEDRIGALEMQTIAVADNRAQLVEHMRAIAGVVPAPLLGEGEKS
jgi:argininosuccinate synthase